MVLSLYLYALLLVSMRIVHRHMMQTGSPLEASSSASAAASATSGADAAGEEKLPALASACSRLRGININIAAQLSSNGLSTIHDAFPC